MSIEAMLAAMDSDTPSNERLVLIVMGNYVSPDYGNRCWVTNQTLCRRTGASRATIQRILRKLEEKGYITDTEERVGKTGQIVVYTLNMEGPQYEPLSKGLICDAKGLICDDKVSHGEAHIPIDPNISQVSKRARVEKQKFEVPKNVNLAAWEEFEAHRKSIRKPLTDLAKKKSCNFLVSYPPEQQKSIVDATIMGGYQGLFAPKVNGPGGGNSKLARMKAAFAKADAPT